MWLYCDFIWHSRGQRSVDTDTCVCGYACPLISADITNCETVDIDKPWTLKNRWHGQTADTDADIRNCETADIDKTGTLTNRRNIYYSIRNHPEHSWKHLSNGSSVFIQKISICTCNISYKSILLLWIIRYWILRTIFSRLNIFQLSTHQWDLIYFLQFCIKPDRFITVIKQSIRWINIEQFNRQILWKNYLEEIKRELHLNLTWS